MIRRVQYVPQKLAPAADLCLADTIWSSRPASRCFWQRPLLPSIPAACCPTTATARARRNHMEFRSRPGRNGVVALRKSECLPAIARPAPNPKARTWREARARVEILLADDAHLHAAVNDLR